MTDIRYALVEFHTAYGCPIRTELTPNPPEAELRKNLLQEEWEEYLEAYEAGDIVELADALGDMLYIIQGTALTYGIDLRAVFEEIHSSNMSKLGEDGLPHRRDDGKILKGPNFFQPNLAKILGVKE